MLQRQRRQEAGKARSSGDVAPKPQAAKPRRVPLPPTSSPPREVTKEERYLPPQFVLACLQIFETSENPVNKIKTQGSGKSCCGGKYF